ncbi:hypothetical protein ACVW0Q_001764 [Thermostichus sp. MS-CIW-21]|jgi:hypothetical protein|uniref:hypothetical protein n=1 Tax=unclassified Synechococcus TaxID=2626047 RepID=UPI0002FC1BA2|nr:MULTISPECIES: hypothetical protein [unclassified Synechococcus]PIK87411.1 hypothetical protein SYN63AY4M2_05510 [Synechococcus sp. 63AY4M2]PIK89793.1 hypothetical protein SYN65AY6A5_09320 [Synechococcus sp. 65AY6A5]PIK93118.1 hypothetical protein SYN65AY6LI_02875 [Synechococcus sp. 65AY6Li]PIK96427.1 hypothetical protein SYN60AY4M2_06065 [Synechococcus sp. 60AY4M2]PIK99024.1 hypothetical protein SYN63AY4M1_03520 [Synechococcus sp. 63AY4M1]
MSPVLWQAIGYAGGISLGIVGLVALVNFLWQRLEQQAEKATAQPAESPSASELGNTSEGSPSA